MKYQVSINWVVKIDSHAHQLRSKMHQATVEAEPGQKCSEFGYPISFRGKLVGVTQEMLNHFINEPGVEVSLHTGGSYIGGEYVFEEIEKDGKFQLRRRARSVTAC
jgi:hypothetical protein